MRYVTPKIGSRKAQTSFYWTSSEDIQVICGCFRGNLDEFKSKVQEVHKETPHLAEYMKQIEIVEFILNH